MNVVEQRLESKTGRLDDCEDGIVVTRSFAAVVDGATDKSGWRDPLGRTGGQLARDVSVEVVKELRATASAREAVDSITARLAEASATAPVDKPSASIGVFSREKREIWLVGDVSYWFADSPKNRRTKALDEVLAAARSIALSTYVAEGTSVEELRHHDHARDDIIPWLQRQHLLRNSSDRWGYGALDGSVVPDALIDVVPVPDDAPEIVLCSDGYPRICPTLEQAERKLSEQLCCDPLCYQTFMSTKGLQAGNVSFDDRAYLRLAI